MLSTPETSATKRVAAPLDHDVDRGADQQLGEDVEDLVEGAPQDRLDEARPVAAAVLPEAYERVRPVVGRVRRWAPAVGRRPAGRPAWGRWGWTRWSRVRRGPDTLDPVSDAPVQPVLVLDFGAQYAQLIARRVREARVYSEVIPSTTPVAEILARRPAAVILSGGPSSVYAEGAPQVDPALFDAGVPAFGICYGHQAMASRSAGPSRNRARRSSARTPLHGAARRPRFPRAPGRADGMDESRRRGLGGAQGFVVTATTDRHSRRGVRGPVAPDGRSAVPP